MVEIEKKRFWELDFLRGICILLMVFDHFFYALHGTFPIIWSFFEGAKPIGFWRKAYDFSIFYWSHPARNIIQFCVICLFMLLCGISCTLSRSPLKRGIKTVLAAALITVVTFIFSQFVGFPITIEFGVIHMYGCAILIYWALSLVGGLIKKAGKNRNGGYRKFGKIAEWSGRLFPAFVGLVVLIMYFAVPWGRFEEYNLSPTVMLDMGDGWRKFLSYFMWFKNSIINSSDYFPLVPWVPIILVGSGIGELVYKTKLKGWLGRLDKNWNKPIRFVGRHTLIVYLLHQVVFLAVFFVAGFIYYKVMGG